VFYDDGMHEDGELLDNLFSGVLQPGLPDGAEIQFYLEVVDLSGQVVVEPDEPVFTRRGENLTLYSLAVAPPRLPPLEISEVVAWNFTGLRDGTNGTPDWVEIRNCSTNSVSLRGVSLAQDLFGKNSRYRFSDADELAPAEHRVIFCDGVPARGSSHAPFSLNRGGDRLVLTALSANGARLQVDAVSFGAQSMDVAWARLGCGGSFRQTRATPRAANIAGVWEGLMSGDGGLFTFGFPTLTNRSYTVQFSDVLRAGAWTDLPPVRGDGLEKTVTQPTGRQQFFRVRSDP
jgi:hypothetical protein